MVDASSLVIPCFHDVLGDVLQLPAGEEGARF